MQDILDESLIKSKLSRNRRNRIVAILLVLSLLVSMDVFWVLRQPGLTLAGDADCGIVEHIHDDTCKNGECDLEEHIHDLSCYSNDISEVETQLDWQNMFANFPYTDNLRKNLVGIAKTQVGYSESSLNFEVGSDGIRRGYTRYGAWYGTPYADWSAMFVSFCLNYAGADLDETPINTGAASMAELWKKLDKYADIGEYKPVAGDLVFFKNNTVGIVTDVHNATFHVIRGDNNDSVRRDVLVLTDSTIAGWGTTVGTVYEQELIQDTPQEETNYSNGYMFDISRGPAVFIFDGEAVQNQSSAMLYSMRRSAVPIIPYLKSEEVKGDYFFTLWDKENHELPKDENGNYIADANTEYKFTASFTSPNGFAPGTYVYQLPDGLTVQSGEGSFVLKDGTYVGDWVVSEDGLITMVFNEHMNSRTDITISATMGVEFGMRDEAIYFDGKITVIVKEPEVEKEPTGLNKWGIPGDESKKQDPSKIYWTIEIQGKEGSNIPGSVISDQIKLGDHYFTQSDIDGGLRIGVGEYDLETGEQLAWHAWEVYNGDPNLVWTETGWTYTMPESVMCKWCPQPVPLGNNGWIYYIEYTSTPEPAGIAGTIWYTNEVTVDGQYMEGWGNYVHVHTDAHIVKDGSFYEDAGSATFFWEIQATVPGAAAGEKAVYLWQILDNLRVKGDEGIIGYVENDANKSIVTATQGDTTFTVPHVSEVTANDRFAWYNQWSSDHGDGIYYSRALVLLCRCNCTKETCQFWSNNSCGSLYWYEADDGYWYTNGMCHCWTEEHDTTFNFFYETDDLAIIEAYGGQGHKLQNEALLQNTVYTQDGTPNTITVGSSVKEVPIPGIFKKELTHDFDGYTAGYKITVNEAKLVLTDGSPLTIHDVMTQTLAYISGSLVITAEDINGNLTELHQDVDYTVRYDGTGNQKDENGKPVHVLDIVILHPQPVKYILEYDATLIMPEQVTGALKYTNSASVHLWGSDISDTTVEKIYADINIAAKSFKVDMFKTCALTHQPLEGAKFGLFNEHGGLITSGVTDATGNLLFQTNIIEGIILREHVLYYIQELDAPPGYRLDDTKYWFCFCDSPDGTCGTFDDVVGEINAIRIPYEQIGKVHAVNHHLTYDMPDTGGIGIYPLMLASIMFIVIPLVYRFIQRRKRERRGDC